MLFTVAEVGQSTKLQPYVNKSLGFALSFPANYRVKELPCWVARPFATLGYQSLLYVSSGVGRSRGNISLILDRHRFSVDMLQTSHSHTGWEAPAQVQIGKYRFYYYGAGGGGVAYPDDYFYDLNGYVLQISFDGPYPPNDKTPSERTKQMEKTVLGTFRTFQPAK